MKFLSIFTLIAMAVAFAAQADEFSGGSNENKPPRYTDEYIQQQILKQLEIVCDDGVCVLASVTTKGDKFSVQLTGGYGNNGAMMAPSNGGIVIGTGQSTVSSPQPYVGLTISYTHMSCTQSILVPESLYIAMNTYLYRLLNEDGSTKKTFTPSEQTMILFYTTVMNQAKGCNGVN